MIIYWLIIYYYTERHYITGRFHMSSKCYQLPHQHQKKQGVVQKKISKACVLYSHRNLILLFMFPHMPLKRVQVSYTFVNYDDTEPTPGSVSEGCSSSAGNVAHSQTYQWGVSAPHGPLFCCLLIVFDG